MAKKKNKQKQKHALHDEQTARLTSTLKTYGDHPSKGLTPSKLHSILEDAEQGNITAQHELFCDMEEKDGHIFADMSKRKRSVLTLDWRIVAPRHATAAEKSLVDEVSDWLNDIEDLDNILLDTLDAVGHGFSALEIGWERLGNIWLPETMSHRSQSWFKLQGGELRLKDNSQEGQELWDYGWVVHMHKARSGGIARSGLHRTLAWTYLFKNYSVRDLAEFLEIYGLPVRVGKYPPGSTELDKNTLLRALQGIGHNAAGIIPDSMVIEFQNAASGSHEPFNSMTEYCERTQSKVILGGTLTSQADGKTSTNALGKIHNEVRHDLLESDAKQLAATLTKQLILMMLQINKPNIDPRRIPKFEFDTRDPDDMTTFADNLPKLVSLGMKIPVAWARDKLAIPEAQDDEEVLTLPRPEMVVPPAMRQQIQTAATSRQYRQVALSQTGEVIYPDQAILDQTIHSLDADELTKQLAPMIDQLVAELKEGASYEDAADILAAAYPQLDSIQMQTALAKAMFVADSWGRLNAS